MAASFPQVVVVGAGMAGLAAVKELGRSSAAVTLVDEHNYTTFPPLLFEAAAALISPEDVVTPIRALLPHDEQVRFRMGRVGGVDWDRGRVLLDDGEPLSFDYLILAPGVAPAFGTVAGAARHALPLKSVTDAIRLRNSLLRCFEAAAAHPQLAEEGATSAAIIGGGASGVEVAGYLADFLFPTFARDYPQLDPQRMRITLLELGDRLLPTFDPALSRYVLDTLGRHGVEVRLGMPVTAVDADGVTLADGGRLAARTVVWAGGVSAPPWAPHHGRSTWACPWRTAGSSQTPTCAYPDTRPPSPSATWPPSAHRTVGCTRKSPRSRCKPAGTPPARSAGSPPAKPPSRSATATRAPWPSSAATPRWSKAGRCG